MVIKKVLAKSEDPQTAIRMYILDNNIILQDSKKSKRQNLMLDKYNSLSSDLKMYIAEFTSESIKAKCLNNEKFTKQIYTYLTLTSSENNWKYANELIAYLSFEIKDDLFTKKLCEILFEIIDQEINFESNETTIISSCLSLIIDIGIQMSKNKINNKYSSHILEYIGSNLIARSNINNIGIRIAIVYYLSRIEENSKLYLNKILSRFGQSLLEHVFYKYFSNSKSSQVAFSFLTEHLSLFLSGSAFLAEMGNSVLQNQMLKNPKEFINFLKIYLTSIKDNLEELKILTIHLSFLLKKSCEINNNELIENFKEIIINHLSIINIQSKTNFIEQSEVIINILSNAHSKNITESLKLITSFYIENKIEKSDKITHRYFQTKAKKNDIKNEDKYQSSNSFEEILILA